MRIGKMICIISDLISQLPVIYTDICQITSGLNFSQPRCVFHQVTLPSASGRNTFFPDGFAPDSRCSGASFYGQKRSADTVGRGAASEITVRNAARKLQVHRYFDNPVASPRSSVTDEGEKAGQKRGRVNLPWSASVADDDKIKKREIDNHLPFFTLRTRS